MRSLFILGLCVFSFGFEFYGLGLETGSANIFDTKDFEFGKVAKVRFSANAETYYLTGELGLSIFDLHDPFNRETFRMAPIVLKMGVLQLMDSGPFGLNETEYRLGAGFGFVQGMLDREWSSASARHTNSKTYSDLRTLMLVEAVYRALFFDKIFFGPEIQYQWVNFTFKDEPFSTNVPFSREYNANGFVFGLSLTFLIGFI